MEKRVPLGEEALVTKGWWKSHQWLVLRRISQLSVLGLFLLGPWFGIWIIKGNIASSEILETVPLTDPYLLLQVFLTQHWPETIALIGAGIVLIFYLLVGGRVYCSWVCPVNMVTDFAAWLRRRFGITSSARLSRNTRYWILGLTLVMALLTGTLAWELVNPVTAVYRGLVFGMGFGWSVLTAVFLFDLVISSRGWCGHLCPVGAFYSLIGRFSLVRVSALRREQCNDCMDCFIVCPEPQVIRPALKGA
ncbi:MAG: quinol dehydrogenase ferredoxin subunit NapH, partial [Thiohalomonadales bacterium]|nr:quinol dehydrogenase ferredoxin subunit NapH [Thiohalomonadales bacterium]